MIRGKDFLVNPHVTAAMAAFRQANAHRGMGKEADARKAEKTHKAELLKSKELEAHHAAGILKAHGPQPARFFDFTGVSDEGLRHGVLKGLLKKEGRLYSVA